MIVREAQKTDYYELYKFMELLDAEFVPPLSLREGGIEGRLNNTLCKHNSNFLIAEDVHGIRGIIGYKKHWKNELDAYVSIVAVHPKYRGNGISKILNDILQKKLKKDGIKYLNVCTWSTNEAALNLYNKQGYKINCIKKNDRGEGIDTIYFIKYI
ncbi:MAG: GNAT family N-acetyltransferase [Methanosarcinales archaeon]